MTIVNELYQKSPDVIFRRVADEYILVPIRQKVVDLRSIYTLNEVSAFIWELIDGKKSISEISDKIIEEFNVEPLQAESDIREILLQLETLSLIQKVDV